jgi:hypothetical protein
LRGNLPGLKEEPLKSAETISAVFVDFNRCFKQRIKYNLSTLAGSNCIIFAASSTWVIKRGQRKRESGISWQE